MQKKGNKYGTHRVLEPTGVLPQPAKRIDNNMDEIYDNEILIDVPVSYTHLPKEYIKDAIDKIL